MPRQNHEAGGLRQASVNAVRRPVLLVLVVLALFVGLRCVQLRADPPIALPWGEPVWAELFAEPAAKAYEARNYALFGSFNTHPADDYRVWRAQSPLWVYGLTEWFEMCGVSYESLRAFSILFSAVGMLALALLGRVRGGAAGVLVAAAVFAFDFYPLHAARVGLMEPALNALLLVSFLALVRSFDNVRWIYVSVAFFVLAILTKQSALSFLPVFLLGASWALARTRQGGNGRIAVPLCVLVVLGVGLAMFLLTDSYLEKMRWNTMHVVTGHDPQTYEQLYAGGVLGGAEFHPLRLFRPWQIMPVASVLALGGLVSVGVVWARRRSGEPVDLLSVLWLACVLAPLLVVDKDARRYDLLLQPPVAVLALLAGVRAIRSARWVRNCAALLLAYGCLAGVWYQYRWASGARFTIEQFGAMLQREVRDSHAVFVGQWSAPLVFDTPYRSFYVKAVFNTRPDTLRQFGITHALLMRSEHTGWRLQSALPRSFARKRFVTQAIVGRTPINLFLWRPAASEREEGKADR